MLTFDQIQENRKKYGIPAEGIAPVQEEVTSETVDTGPKTAKSLIESMKSAPQKDKMGQTGEDIGGFFGGDKIGELFGTAAAKLGFQAKEIEDFGISDADRKKAEEMFYKRTGKRASYTRENIKKDILNSDTFNGPSGKELLGDTGKVALNFLPFGKLSKSLQVAAEAAGIGSKLAAPVSRVAAGITGGYGLDVAENLREEKNGGEIFKPGAGTATAGILGPALEGGGAAFKAATSKLPAKMVNSLIKPRLSNLAYGHNPGKAVVEEGIVGLDMEDLINKISKKKGEVGKQIGAMVDSPEASSRLSEASDAFEPIDEAIKDAMKAPRTNKGLIQRLSDIKSDLMGEVITPEGQILTRKLEELTPRELLDIKKEIGDLTRYTGNPSDDELTNKALQRTYTKVKDKLNSVLKEAGFTDIEKINEKYGNLTEAEISTKYRDKILERQNVIGLDSKVSGVLGGLGTLASGGSIGASAIAGVLADKIAGSTAFKTAVAQMLSKADQPTLNAFFTKHPEIAQVLIRAFQASEEAASE